MIAAPHDQRHGVDDLRARYYGKYRGTVWNNVDVKGEGKIQVLVPAIAPTPLVNWARVCTPTGGFQHGIFSAPALNAGVWVEFEQGDIDYPIWTGCFYGSSAELPKQAPIPNPLLQAITLQTPSQNCLVINDLPGPAGGVQIRIHGTTLITAAEGYIALDNGMGASIKMIGPTISIDAQSVTVNQGALMIT
jgi:uncharacterized protein involved in type VI secretion and phage assembly